MAINSQLLAVVQHIESERGVSREIVLTAIEQALSQAARKNRDFTDDLRVAIDRKDFSVHVYDTFVITEDRRGPGMLPLAVAKKYCKNTECEVGSIIELEIPAAKLGRIAAQTSRQVIMQKIREAERTNTFVEYKDRVGDIVTGTVTAIEQHRDVFVTVGKVEMLMPGKERIPSENYQVGDTVKAIVLRVDPEAHGPNVIISRASPKFLEALFRLEVSEISDGIVEIMGVSRDPGFRAKIAVRASNEKVDPVGACVGQRGTRVKAIVNELSGEKIDVVRWNADIREYVKSALGTGKIESIEVSQGSHHVVKVLVAPDDYSEMIGKRGQNVRLTTKLTGWHIDVKKSMATASFEDQKDAAIKELVEMLSVSTKEATTMVDAGYLTVAEIAADDEASFIASTGLDEITAKGVYAAAKAVADIMENDDVDSISEFSEEDDANGEENTEN